MLDDDGAEYRLCRASCCFNPAEKTMIMSRERLMKVKATALAITERSSDLDVSRALIRYVFDTTVLYGVVLLDLAERAREGFDESVLRPRGW